MLSEWADRGKVDAGRLSRNGAVYGVKEFIGETIDNSGAIMGPPGPYSRITWMQFHTCVQVALARAGLDHECDPSGTRRQGFFLPVISKMPHRLMLQIHRDAIAQEFARAQANPLQCNLDKLPRIININNDICGDIDVLLKSIYPAQNGTKNLSFVESLIDIFPSRCLEDPEI